MNIPPPPAGPVLIERPTDPAESPATALPVPDLDLPQSALLSAAAFAARPSSRAGRLFWASFTAFAGFVLSLAAWDFITGLFTRNPLLGYIALSLLVLLLIAAALIALRELAAFARLRRLDDIRRSAETAIAKADLPEARRIADRLVALYGARPEMARAAEKLASRRADQFDADGLLALAETNLLAPLDLAAIQAVEKAARQVALVTAFIPLALADVVTALIANLGMIRRIAEIYGGRSGTLGNWRLTRTVLTHLAATGALAIGDDMIHSVAGGGLLSKLSRRFGEGVVNGALTARVGVAAIEVCRPLPFRATPKPRVTALVQRALTGLFGQSGRGGA